MDTLRSLLIQNQTNLDRLRARLRYLFLLLNTNEFDTHKLYGPYAEFWDEWQELARMIRDDTRSDTEATIDFVDELRDFILESDAAGTKKRGKIYAKRRTEMEALAKEALACQRDMIKMADMRIAEHKEFTHRLLLVEAIDGLSDE